MGDLGLGCCGCAPPLPSQTCGGCTVTAGSLTASWRDANGDFSEQPAPAGATLGNYGHVGLRGVGWYSDWLPGPPGSFNATGYYRVWFGCTGSGYGLSVDSSPHQDGSNFQPYVIFDPATRFHLAASAKVCSPPFFPYYWDQSSGAGRTGPYDMVVTL